jgi:hypothetical protein
VEFLFDDRWVDRRGGVRRVLGVPRKEHESVFRPEMPWERAGIGAQQALHWDEATRRYKFWYRAFDAAGDGEREESRRMFLCYAESADGVRWERPELGQFEFEGNTRNNILSDAKGADGVAWNVVHDPDDPDPERRYKSLGFAFCGTSSVPEAKPGDMGVCVAYSPDGLVWTAPKLVMTATDMTDCDCILDRRDPTTGLWTAFLRPRTHPKRRFIGLSTSDDFDRWTYPRMLLTPTAEDSEWTEFYGLTATLIDRWRVGCLWMYHNNPEYSPMTMELVYSRDGSTYDRAMPGASFLPLGADGSFDSRMVMPVSIPDRGSEILIYYQGCNWEHGSDRGMPMQHGRSVEGEEPTREVGLARLPWGHFCGLRADLDGMVESKWITNYGSGGVDCLAEIDDGGWIRAEIVDQYGDIVPGWDRSASDHTLADDGRLRLWWGDESLVGSFGQESVAGGRIGHVVRLRFHFHRTTLFGWQIGEEGATRPYGGST